jgi:hypothetical protein
MEVGIVRQKIKSGARDYSFLPFLSDIPKKGHLPQLDLALSTPTREVKKSPLTSGNGGDVFL